MSDPGDDGDISLSLDTSHDRGDAKATTANTSKTEPQHAEAEEGGDIAIALDSDDEGEMGNGPTDAAVEPVPLDAERVAGPSRHVDDEDVTAGAWSVSITPAEEMDGIQLDIPSNANQDGHSDHHNINLNDERRQSLTHYNAHDTAAYYDTRRPSILSMDEEVNLNTRDRQYHEDALHEYRSRHNAHESIDIDTMGMRFEDVMLDGQQASNHAIYGQGGLAASKSRSSLEIRSDSISSDGRQKPLGAASTDQARGLRFWRKNTDEAAKEEAQTNPPASPSTSQPPRYPPEDLRGPESLSVDLASPPVKSPHRVAGRYKGRLSQPSSPAGSPQLSRSTWLPPVEKAVSKPPSIVSSSSVTMMVAGDDGEIEVTEIDEPPVSAVVPPEADSAADVKIPEPKASSNESEEAVNVKVSEQVVASQEHVVQQAPRGGRSAGPLDTEQGGSVVDADVRQETPAEAEARQQAGTSKGGRSAGPVNAAAASEEVAATASPPSASTSSATTSKAGGRSAGPILDSTPTSPKTHARKLSNGPSALEKHMSRTRQATLPPKTRTEDQRHLRDFEAIMREYKAAEAKRQKEEEERQRQKETELREATKIWEDEILKDWKVARSNPRLKDVWWKGAPPSLRGRVWQLAIGNMQMLPRNLCTTTKGRVAELKKAGKWPPHNALSGDTEDVEAAMQVDIERTLPSLKLFQESGPMHDDLREMLECLVLLRSDQAEEISRTREANSNTHTAQLYVPGLSLLSAMLLLNLSQSEALIALLNLIHSKLWLQSIYSLDSQASSAFERVLNTFLADQLPKVYANMQSCQISPAHYAREWVQNLFVPLLPLEVVSRLWDNIVLEEGDSLIVRSCLALVALLSSRLYVSDGVEVTSILQGRNRAALAAWYRSLSSAPAKDHASVQAVASLPNSPLSPGKNGATIALPPALEQQQDASRVSNGTQRDSEESTTSPQSSSPSIPHRSSSRLEPPPSSATSVEAPDSWVPRDSLLSIYGIDEDKLFSTLEEQVGADGWWRQSTMDRLVDRELGG